LIYQRKKDALMSVFFLPAICALFVPNLVSTLKMVLTN
jgi:hypothetical protein